MKPQHYSIATVALGFGSLLLLYFIWHMPQANIQTTMDNIQPNPSAMHTQTDAMAKTHEHPIRNIAATSPPPSLRHLVFPDAMDGYNLQIMVDNFTFTPASINREVVENEGHAHLYINGQKIARLYSNWYHVPSSLLQQGRNIISVTLNANDHSEWAINNQPIASSVLVYNKK